MSSRAREAAVALAHRGVRARVVDLGKRTIDELADVIAWVEMGERYRLREGRVFNLDTAPAWLRDWLALGLAGPIGGVCLQCGCTDEHACGDGCWWVDDSHTRCSSCGPVESPTRTCLVCGLRACDNTTHRRREARP